MLLGVVGLYFELSSPGAILPGIVGGIALLLALYAFSVLPVNLAGIALILFAIGLFVAEIKVASHGLLAVGGAIALVAGSPAALFRARRRGGLPGGPGDHLPALALTLVVIVALSWRTVRAAPPAGRVPGSPGMIGQTARVVEPLRRTGRGRVHVHGEYWDAVGPGGSVAAESAVRIVRVEGLKLVESNGGPDESPAVAPGCLIAVFVGLLFLFKWINILKEYERAVTFWLGRLGKRTQGARPRTDLLAVRDDGAHLAAHGRPRRAAAGHHHARTTSR